MPSILKRVWCSSALIVCGLLLSGCAGYDVELKGGVFDYLGVSQIGKKKAEPQMAQRTGIVVPPRTAALPAPGSRPAPQQVASSGGLQWPVSPESVKAANQQALQAKHDAFCAEQKRKYESKMIPDMEDGPLGSCRDSILKNFGISSDKIFGNKPKQAATQ